MTRTSLTYREAAAEQVRLFLSERRQATVDELRARFSFPAAALDRAIGDLHAQDAVALRWHRGKVESVHLRGER